MLMQIQSALTNRLQRFVALTHGERHFLSGLEKNGRSCAKGSRLINIGDLNDKVIVIKSGWAVLKSCTRQHGNQIIRIYLPGEIVGFAELGSARATHQLIMQTDGVVSEQNRKDFHQGISEHPRLLALFLAISSFELNALRSNLTCVRSMDAASNLKFFLLQLRARLHVANVGNGNHFEVPFSQVEIAQSVGLTSIYVNKLLKKFVDSGELKIKRPYFKLLDRKGWTAETEFVDAFQDIDTSWFPSPHERKVVSLLNVIEN